MNGRCCDNCEHYLSDEDFAAYGSWSYTCPECGFRYSHHSELTANEQVEKYNEKQNAPPARRCAMTALDAFMKHAPDCRKVTWHFSSAPCDCGMLEAAAELAALRGENERLRAERDALHEAFKRYASHLPNCPNKFKRNCDCEYYQTLRELEALAAAALAGE